MAMADDFEVVITRRVASGVFPSRVAVVAACSLSLVAVVVLVLGSDRPGTVSCVMPGQCSPLLLLHASRLQRMTCAVCVKPHECVFHSGGEQPASVAA